MLTFWVLDGRTPLPVTDPVAWAYWMDEARKSGAFRVGADHVDGLFVSTVFLGIDHGAPRGHVGPVLFETMILSEHASGDYQRRYRTWDEAEAGHRRAVAVAERLVRRRARRA